jgi:hypothetical protein
VQKTSDIMMANLEEWQVRIPHSAAVTSSLMSMQGDNLTAAIAPYSFEAARDGHLFGPGPKRLLSLDGGGVRGALTVAFLEHIESLRVSWTS